MKKVFGLIVIAVALMGFASMAWAGNGVVTTSAKQNFQTGLYNVVGHSLTSLKLGIKNATATDDATTAQWTTTNEMVDSTGSGSTGYTTGGKGITNATVVTTGTSVCVSGDNFTLTNVTNNAAGVTAVLYDSSTTNTACTASHAPFWCCSGSGAGTCANATIAIYNGMNSGVVAAGSIAVTGINNAVCF
jgi:hypothetical protein